MRFDEIIKLDTMLTRAGIPHIFSPLYDGYQILVYYNSGYKPVMDDCVIHSYSNGHEEGLLETYKLGACCGWETAEEIFAGWKEMYEKGNE